MKYGLVQSKIGQKFIKKLCTVEVASVAQELDDARTDFNDFLRQYLSTIIAS